MGEYDTGRQPEPEQQPPHQPPQQQQYQPTQLVPSNVPKEERTMAMLCHLISFSGYIVPFGNIIGPLVIWLIKKEEMPLVDNQGKESLNFQITLTIAFLVLLVLSIVPFAICLTLPVILGLTVASLIFVIIATIKSNDGIPYRYPCTIRFIS